MNKSGTKSDVTSARNLVRGALSGLRAASKPDAKRDAWRDEQTAQKQINRALAIARRTLGRDQLAGFERWVVSSVADQSRTSNRVGVSLTALGLLPSELAARDFVTEFSLATMQLERRMHALTVFASDAHAIAKAIATSSWDMALVRLAEVVKRDGHSYWSVETQLAIIQANQGIEAAKARVSAMSICALGLHPFFLYNIGVRNEPAQNSARYKSSICKRIDDSDLSPDMKVYSKYRLCGELALTTRGLSQVVACERLTTAVDLFVTILKVCVRVQRQPAAFDDEVNAIVARTYNALEPIRSILGIAANASSRVNSPLSDLICEAIRVTIEPSYAPLTLVSQDVGIAQGISSQLSTRDDGVAAEQLAKQLMNLSWLPIAIEIGDLTDVRPLPTFFLGSRFDINEHRGIVVAIESVFKNSVSEPTSDPWRGPLEALIRTRQREASELPCDIVVGLRSALASCDNLIVQDALRVALAYQLLAAEKLPECLEVCAVAGMRNDRLISLLPIVEMLQGLSWPTLRNTFESSVDLPIVLDHFLRIVDDRKPRTYKRYAVEELMKYYGCNGIVDLLAVMQGAGISVDKIEYLFSHVCDIATLELLPGIGESRKVRTIRVQLLRQLAITATTRAMEYVQEADAIEDSLQVDDGLSVLDDSKVHVDEKAVLNAVNQEFSADFQRYLSLVSSGIGVADSVNEVLRAFNNPSAKTFQIPKNDADDLLTQLVGAILDRFLFDPASGLDITIGRRIRHGTISGELRGVLEKADLIGYRTKSGAVYEASPLVKKLCLTLEPKRSRIVAAAFARFSESIDQLVTLLRDEYFHVRSKSKPRGLFDLQLHAILFALARSIAQTCTTIDQFSKECAAIFWFFLSGRVDVLRPPVEAEIKRHLLVTFSKATDELRAQGISDPNFYATLQQASDELQRRATAIANWIGIPKINLEGRSYAMQQVVDVAVAVVSSQRPGFRPKIASVLPENLLLDLHGFSIVSDALYIALDNVSQHSGKKIDNRIDINVKFDKAESLLRFEIISELAPSARSPDKEAHVDGILSDIKRRAYGERVRLDTHSGLFKLAAIVNQSERTSITFGYAEGNRFRLEFDLVYVGFEAEEREAPQFRASNIARSPKTLAE
jgi:hypothetical protein